jgi:nicotinamidase/pyrazinamidase
MVEPESPALLVVDVQNDFCPGGALAVENGDRVVPVINRLASRAAALGIPIYASRDWHPVDSTHFVTGGGPWPAHCVAGTEGARLHPGLTLPPGAMIVTKGVGRDDQGYSVFEGKVAGRGAFADDLAARGVEHLIICGLATDYCVRATALDARTRGFGVSVVEDAIAPVDVAPGDGDRALDQMRHAGAVVLSAADVF